MILADKILTHRKKNGWSQEELAEKLGVSRQSISKWEGAASIPDIGKIIELAAIFGVTTDYLLKDSEEEPTYTDRDETDRRARVSVVEANAFIAARRARGKQIGLGVALCILSPVLLVLLLGLADLEYLSISEEAALGIGLTALFVLAAAAVSIFIFTGVRNEGYSRLLSGEFVLEYGVEGIVRERRNGYLGRYTLSLAAGVVLCIVSVIPIVTGAVMGPSAAYVFLITAFFFIVALGVYFIISAVCIKDSFDILLRDGERSPRAAGKNRVVERIAGAYWPIVTAVYLGWSFLGGDWHISWVVWPIAALLFSGIAAAFSAGDGEK